MSDCGVEVWVDVDDTWFVPVACCACVVVDVDVEVVVWASAVCPPSAMAMVGINMAIAIRPARTFPLKLPFVTFLLLSADDRLGRRAEASPSGHPVDCLRWFSNHSILALQNSIQSH